MDKFKERLDLLIEKRDKLNKEIKTINDLYRFESFVDWEIISEGHFVKKHPEMNDSFMLGRLKNVKIKIRIAKELMIKNKPQKAFEPFEMAFRHLNQDYDYVISVFRLRHGL